MVLPKSSQRGESSIPTQSKILLAISLGIFIIVGVCFHWFSLLLSLLSNDQDSSIFNSLKSMNDGGIAVFGAQEKLELQSSVEISQHQLKQDTTQNHQLSSQEILSLMQQQTEPITKQLSQINALIPLSNQNKEVESKLETILRKECLPGRDDSQGEINPTTHKQRECLRHVPKNNIKNGTVKGTNESNQSNPMPRIGILAPPGYISESFALWMKQVLSSASNSADGAATDVTLDIIPTSHVPVYGYGKSHGWTKIIRFVTPLPLAVLDAYFYLLANQSSWSSGGNGASVGVESTLTDMSDLETNSQIKGATPATLSIILQLLLRWHCRLSHVSAHTAMLTLSLNDVVQNPLEMMTSVLAFVRRGDWEWEGGGKSKPQQSMLRGQQLEWRKQALGALALEYNGADGYFEGNGSMKDFLIRTTYVLTAAGSYLEDSVGGEGNSGGSLQKSIQEAFASEMKRSKDLTVWPCPSFWEGIDALSLDATGDNHLLKLLANQLVPNCKENDPFVRCTVNKDRCEVKGESKCS